MTAPIDQLQWSDCPAPETRYPGPPDISVTVTVNDGRVGRLEVVTTRRQSPGHDEAARLYRRSVCIDEREHEAIRARPHMAFLNPVDRQSVVRFARHRSRHRYASTDGRRT